MKIHGGTRHYKDVFPIAYFLHQGTPSTKKTVLKRQGGDFNRPSSSTLHTNAMFIFIQIKQ